MVDLKQMLQSHPQKSAIDVNMLSDCLQTCLTCQIVCISCADACMDEAMFEKLKRCIRLNLDCAEVCRASAAILARQTETEWQLLHPVVEAMANACRLCGEECAKHAHMQHCRICAEVCVKCETSCRSLLKSISALS